MKEKSKTQAKPQDLDRFIKIYIALKQTGRNFADVARELRVGRPAIHHFAYGSYTSRRFNNWVRDNLGLDL